MRLQLEELENRITPAIFYVVSLGDTGQGVNQQGDLRYCINQLNGSNDATNSINFEVGGTIHLTKALPAINKNVTIYGESNDVQGSDSPANAFRIFKIDQGVTAEIDQLYMLNGYETKDGKGGGIYNLGNLTLSEDVVKFNETTGNGGGIFNGLNASLNLIDTNVLGNVAQGSGGGIANVLGTVSLCCGSSVVGNRASGGGGGISNSGDDANPATINCYDNTQISGNSDALVGGGVSNGKDATFTMNGGSIAYNEEAGALGGGLYNDSGGTVELQGGVLVEYNSAVNFGGGMYLGDGSTTTLDTVTVQGNKLTGVPKGVGIYWQNGGNLTYTGLTDNDDPNGKPVQGG